MENPVLQKFCDSQNAPVEQVDAKGLVQDRQDSFPTNRELKDLNALRDPNTPDSEEDQDLDSDNEGEKDSSGVTKMIKKFSLNPFGNKKKYHTISDDLRQKLIDAVENDGQKIKHVAKKLNINYSSAKSICQVFKREGRLNKKTFKRRGPPDASDSGYGSSSYSNIPAPSMSSSLVNNLAQNSQGIEAVTEPEQDNLLILKERLLKSRISSLKSSHLSGQGPNDPSQNGYSEFKLNLNDDPMKRLESMIVQNSKILGEDFMPPSSSWKNPEVNNHTAKTSSNSYSLSNTGSLTPDASWLNSNGNDVYQHQIRPLGISNGGFNQAQSKNNNMPGLFSRENDFGARNNHNNASNFINQQNPDNNYAQPNPTQQQYFVANNNSNNNQANLYQPVIYYIPQQQQGNNSTQDSQGAQGFNNLQGVQYFQNQNGNNNIGYLMQPPQNMQPQSENNNNGGLRLNYPLIQQPHSGNMNMM